MARLRTAHLVTPNTTHQLAFHERLPKCQNPTEKPISNRRRTRDL